MNWDIIPELNQQYNWGFMGFTCGPRVPTCGSGLADRRRLIAGPLRRLLNFRALNTTGDTPCISPKFQEIISYYLSRDGETLQLHTLYLHDSMEASAFNLSEWIQVIKRRKSSTSGKS